MLSMIVRWLSRRYMRRDARQASRVAARELSGFNYDTNYPFF